MVFLGWFYRFLKNRTRKKKVPCSVATSDFFQSDRTQFRTAFGQVARVQAICCDVTARLTAWIQKAPGRPH
jgi:hypothetical protein